MCCVTEKHRQVRQDGARRGNIAFTERFFQVSTFKTDGFMIGYTLIGGGYGHGIGMSQNGGEAYGGGVCQRRRNFGVLL